MNLRIHRDPDSVPAPLGRRILARIHGWRLDHELAAGADPLGDPILAERAARLTAPANRHQLADRLRALVEGAERAPQWSAAAPVARKSVRLERDQLLELAQRLDASGPVGRAGRSGRKRPADGQPLAGLGARRPRGDRRGRQRGVDRDRGPLMDVLMIAIAVVSFVAFYFLIEGIDRV